MSTFEKNIHDLGRNQRNRIGSLNNCRDQSFEFLFLCQNVSSLDIRRKKLSEQERREPNCGAVQSLIDCLTILNHQPMSLRKKIFTLRQLGNDFVGNWHYIEK
jgi:hypothetical protein